MSTTYKINHQISAKEVRLLNEDGTQVGVVSILDARNKAAEIGTDLVEIAPLANPPVVKLIDFQKFRYQLSKKEQEEKRKQKGGELKEVIFTPFMADNDFQHRMHRVEEFLKDNNKVRLVIKFRSARFLSRKEYGYGILKRAVEAVNQISIVDQPAKMLGKNITLTLSPHKK